MRERLAVTASKKGLATDDCSTRTEVIMILKLWQGRGPKQKLNMQSIRNKGRQSDKKDGQVIRRPTTKEERDKNRGAMERTKSKKAEQAETAGKNIRKQRAKRGKMTERRSNSGFQREGSGKDSIGTHGRIEIEIESSEETNGPQIKEKSRKCQEQGQSSIQNNQEKDKATTTSKKKRGRGRPRKTNEMRGETSRQTRKRRRQSTIDKAMDEAEKAYNYDAHQHFRNIIEAMENQILEEPSDPEMNEWSVQLPDPGNTRGRLTLYRRALHIYWVLKHILAKAMEKVATEMVDMAQEVKEAKQGTTKLEETIAHQNLQLKEIKDMLEAMQASRADSNGKKLADN